MDFFKSMQTGAAENGMVQWIPYAQEPADGPEITYRPCMFPHDQEEYEKNIFEEDLENDGSDDDDDDDVRGSVPEGCELCRVEKCDLSAKTKERLGVWNRDALEPPEIREAPYSNLFEYLIVALAALAPGKYPHGSYYATAKHQCANAANDKNSCQFRHRLGSLLTSQ